MTAFQKFLPLLQTFPSINSGRDGNRLISESTGAEKNIVEDYLQKAYPHGSIGAFMTSYFEMAFKGTEEATDFEVATVKIFKEIFGYNAIHLGLTGSMSAPDVLLISDDSGYQAIIDNKTYSKYSIIGDHHNRMVHNYIERIGNYSQCKYPIGFFTYIEGGLISTIDSQIRKEVDESGVNRLAITVSNFIKMIEIAQKKPYSHDRLKEIFGVNRQVLLGNIKNTGGAFDRNVNYQMPTQMVAEDKKKPH